MRTYTRIYNDMKTGASHTRAVFTIYNNVGDPMQVSVEECACESLFGERTSYLLGQRGTQEMSHCLLPPNK